MFLFYLFNKTHKELYVCLHMLYKQTRKFGGLHVAFTVYPYITYLKRLLVDQAVNQDEALSVLNVKIPHGGELLCPRCVQNLQHRWRRVHFDLLSIEIFDGRVVFLDEGASDELDGQRGLADAATAQNDHFVFFHWCGRGKLT